jgi:hypothetical protein
MRIADRSGRTAVGCLVALLVAALVVLLVPAMVLMFYAEPYSEAAASPEVTSILQSVRVAGHDLAWVKAEARWSGNPARPTVTLTSRSVPWAAADGEVVEPKVPGEVPALDWRLRVGLLGFAERYVGATPLPTPAEPTEEQNHGGTEDTE